MTSSSVATVVRTPESSGRLRSLLWTISACWDCDGERLDDAELVLGELVSNAVRHAAGDTLQVRLCREADLLRIEVHDASPVGPAPRKTTVQDEDGRGLLIIGCLTEQWGWDALDTGKVVWADLLMSTAETQQPQQEPLTATAGEAERVTELYRYGLPDATPSPDVRSLVVRAAGAAGVPMATLNLLDTERQWQVAATGFEGVATVRQDAMCNVTVALGAFVHVPDAQQDDRFADSPWVNGRQGNVRFYASAPLRTPRGHIIGTLCVFDTEPHDLSEGQIAKLTRLAARVMRTLERERRDRERAHQ